MSNPECLSTEQNQLIIDHVHLVPPAVKRFMATDPRRPDVDVESDANFGLFNAAVKYDGTHAAAPFDIYANTVINHAMSDGARRYFGTTTTRLSSFDVRNVSLDDTDRNAVNQLSEAYKSPETIFFESYDAAQALSLLLPRERICLLRYYVEGLDMNTIALELDLNKSSVSRILNEARETLQNNKRREKRAGR